MQGVADTLLQQAQALSLLEIVAVVMALMYLLLAIRQIIWCWLGAGVSAVIYVYLFFDAKLYMQSALNAFYFAMAIYGWTNWRYGHTETDDLPVVRWSLVTHGYATLAIVIIAAISGFLLSSQTDAEHAYVDSLIAWSAIWSAYLVARKVLENWWYWLAIDIASMFISWSRDLQLTSMLFAVYVVVIPFGLVSWTRSYREAQA